MSEWLDPLLYINENVNHCKFSEWVSDCCLTPIQFFFHLYHGENKLIFNEMVIHGKLIFVQYINKKIYI